MSIQEKGQPSRLQIEIVRFTLSIFFAIIVFPLFSFAQEESETVHYGKKYVDLNVKALDRYASRIEKQQLRLLRNLKKKERRLARRLKRTDSAAHARMQAQPLSFDSISRMLKPDSATLAAKTARKTNSSIDSLKKIQSFISAQSNALSTESLGNKELNDLQAKLNYQQYINGLIDQRGQGLNGVAGDAAGSIPAFKGIQKQLFYGKAKMRVFKQLKDDPSIVEEKALEYLQGIEGFDKSFISNNSGTKTHQASNVDDLEKMGFQTKRQMNAHLQEKFGSNLSQVQEKLSEEIDAFHNPEGQAQNLLHNEAEGLRQAQADLKQGKSDLKETNQSLSQLRRTDKSFFKVNPMRGLPFYQRLEKQYNFQTVRASINGTRPATLDLSGMIGFRHTPRVSYGLGAFVSIGLGQNWSNIRLSFEGIGIRSYAIWDCAYGVGFYGGYERRWVGSDTEGQPAGNLEDQPHNGSHSDEGLYLGLTKRYRLNSKWNGQVQVLLDVWWRNKGLTSPVVIRFASFKF